MNQEGDSSQRSRQTAYHVAIKEIHGNDYIKSEGEWEPNYIIIRGRKVSRANIIGVVISLAEGDQKGFSIDDGTGTISIRIFDQEQPLPDVEIGDIVMVIGRPREYNGEKYIVPEIVKKVKNEAWMELRKKELGNIETVKPEPIKQPEKKEEVQTEEVVEESSSSEKIFSIIKKLDSGEGADIEEVIKQGNIPDGEKVINSLLAEGEIFEVKPGRIKVLE